MDGVDAATFATEQLMRDRSRDVWEWCDELELLSRWSEEVAFLSSDEWRTVIDGLAREGRIVVSNMVATFVSVTEEDRREELTQGVLF